jgi:Tol biopolymer transport system component
MTDQELERRLRDWYRTEIPAGEAAPTDLRDMVAAIARPSTVLRPRFGSRRGMTLLAAAALVSLLAGTAVVGGFLPPRPNLAIILPSPAPSVLPSVRPSVAPEAGWIVYTRWRTIQKGQEDCTTTHICYRSSVFISKPDGSDERLLDPRLHSSLIAASPDGSKLIILRRDADGDHPYLTDADGSSPQRLDTGCRPPCVADWIGTTNEPGGFSPDGRRLAFVRGFSDDIFGDPRSVIAIMDLATGAVVELDSTAGVARVPSWSPDGAHLVFGQYVVDADGSNLQQVMPGELAAGEGPSARNARWSPDGSLIVFTSSIETVAIPGVIDNSQRLSDIYTVRPDGTDLRRLTTDTVGPLGTTEPGDFGARFPSWTRDGRIIFLRDPAPGETVMQLWVMDRDGGNATRLDPSDAATLTAIGCVSCPYPATDTAEWPGLPSIGFWMPAR